LVILHLIAEKPRHGYEIIKEIEDQVGGTYSPSPGVVYPTLTLLEELDLRRSIPATVQRSCMRSPPKAGVSRCLSPCSGSTPCPYAGGNRAVADAEPRRARCSYPSARLIAPTTTIARMHYGSARQFLCGLTFYGRPIAPNSCRVTRRKLRGLRQPHSFGNSSFFLHDGLAAARLSHLLATSPIVSCEPFLSRTINDRSNLNCYPYSALKSGARFECSGTTR
jgi:hypothetical protein